MENHIADTNDTFEIVYTIWEIGVKFLLFYCHEIFASVNESICLPVKVVVVAKDLFLTLDG